MRTLRAELLYAIVKYLEEESCNEAAELVRRFIDENNVLPKRVNTLGKLFDNDFKSFDNLYHGKDPKLLLKYYEFLVSLLKKREWNVAESSSIFGITARLDRCTYRFTHADLYSGALIRRHSDLIGDTCINLHPHLSLVGHSQAHRNAIYCLQFDHRGEYVFTGSDDYTIKIWSLQPAWNTKNVTIRHVLRGHVAEIIEIALSSDNHLLASVDSRSCLIIWCIRTGQPILTMRGSPINRVLSGLCFLPVPRSLPSENDKIANKASVEGQCNTSSATVDDITGWLAITSFGGFLHLIPYKHHSRSQLDSDASFGGHQWWSCCAITVHPTVRFTTAAEGTLMEFWPSITCMDVSPGSALIATGCSDQRVRLYHLVHPTKPELAAVLDAHEECVNSVAFSHCGLKLASGSSDAGSCWLWRLQAGQWRSVALTCRKRIKCRPCLLAWSMHDKYLIASMKNGSVYVYFGDSGHLATVIEGHEGAVHSVTPSPLHEEILATAGVDGRFQIWHIERHRDYAARQEASINSGLASNTGANDTDDPKVSSSTSPLLFYYRYPPGRFHLAAGVVWLPAESTTADQPVWSGARRAVRETPAGTGPGHETSSDAYTHHGISSSSQLHQRITACRALPTSEGVGFVLVTKNGLMSVFRPGFRDVEQSSDSSLAAWGDHTISRFDPNAQQNKVDEQFFHWELDSVVWRPTVIDESDPDAVRVFQNTASILGSPLASQAAGAHCRVRGQRNPRSGGILERQARGPNRSDNSNDTSNDSTINNRIASENASNSYKPPATVLFEIIHDPSGVPFHRLPPPYLTNFVGSPLSAEAQLRVPGRFCLEDPMDLVPTLTIDEDGVDIVLDDIQFCTNVPPDYCPPIRAATVRPITGKTYMWQSLWLDGRHPLIEPLTEDELELHMKQLCSLYREEIEFYLSKGNTVASFGEAPTTSDKPYMCIQPTRNSLGTPDSRSSTFYRDLISSMGEIQLDRTNTTGAVTGITGSMEPVVELPGPSFLHAFLAKRFNSRNGTNQNVVNGSTTADLIHGTPTTELTNGECRPSPTQSSNADVNTTMLSSSNDQSVVRVVDELDDAEEEDLDDASEESEWSEHIDVEIGWWHRQRRRPRPRRSATAHEAEEQQRIGDTSSAPDVPSAQSITSVRRNSRAQQSRTRRRRLSNTGRYKQRQHQQHGRQRGVSVSVHPSRRSIRQQHRLILRRRILREMRLAETRVERDDQQQLRRSERRLRGCIRRSSRSSLRNNESVPEPIVDSNVVKSMTPSKKPTEETELADLVPVRRERLKRRLIRSMDYALFLKSCRSSTASSVPLSAIPPEGYLGPDCEGPVYSPDDSASVLWPGPHFDWVSTLHPTATPYVPQVGDSLVYIVRGHRDYLAQSWQSSELPSLVPAAEHGDSGLVTGTCPAGNLPWLSWPEIPPYTCGVITEIHYTTVRTITNDSTARIPTSTYRGARAGAAWRRRGIRSEIKHAKTSSKRLPTGSAHVCPSGTSSISTSSIVPSVAFSGDSFVRLVTLRLCVNPKDQPYAHLATTTADCRPNGKLHGAESANVYIDVTYHDVDGVLDFLILRHLFDVAIRRQWKRGDLFICPVGDVWWTGRVLHSPSNFLVNPKAAVCQPSTSSVPVPPKCTKDPWLACFIRWSDSDDAENQTDDKLDLSLLDIADSSYWDTDSRDNLPDNVDRLSPWDMHIPYSNPSASAHSRMCPSQSQIRELYGVPSDSPYGDTQSTCKESHMDKAIRLKKWASRAQTVLACFQEIMKLPASELFNRPVDLVSYPDYLFVNPYPVDLALIVARLTAGFYRQPEAVRSDLQHLVDNAVRYNRTESAVVQHARLVFQLAVRALESNRFKPSQVTKEYERLCRIESDGTQMTSTSLRRSHSRSKSPGLKSESQPSAPQRRPVTDAEDIETTTLAHCETRLYSSPAHHVRHSQRKRQSRSRTDSSSETKTGSAFDVDEENENDPLGPNETNSCSCSFSPSQWVPRCMSLMKQLCSHDRSMFFRESIDTELYPDYKEIVSVPMDLSTVQKRLRSTLDAIHPRYRDLRSRASFGHRRRRPTYTCPHSFVRDLYRIVRNSKLYNDDPETVVYGDTRWLEDWIERMIVTSLQQHGLWSTPETRENKTDSLLHSRWRKTRGRPSGFRARSRLNNRSHVRGPLYKRPRVLTQFPSKKIYPKTQTKGNPTADLPHRTSSGRVVRPPLRNSGTIPYTSSLSSDGGLSDVPEEQRQMPLPQFNVIKRGRRTHLSSTSQRRSETPLRRSKRCCRRIGRHRSKLQSDSDDHGGESDELD